MRIWDLPPSQLCAAHLLGEHRELHAVWSVITNSRRGYAQHPEVTRWRGRLLALYRRHESLVREMRRRGWPSGTEHRTPLNASLASGEAIQRLKVDSLKSQRANLKAKGCQCKV